ncbi:hypothetical protein C2R22_14950 [Salinigranum rubrum]|uniref:DUF7344 domain-containing protein n=1 Tax=Salinigranum rubrum TaxID=755307 RepID=A0A2I8VLG9_9EURY|nr:hypothetical protein [Salinigranum rubrum]AUV82780.1 hypothetical protein C2R22_14950 [Salinigranum rubrum]
MTVRSRTDEQTGPFGTSAYSAETIRALSDARRRRIVATLLERTDPVPVDDLASAVVEADGAGSPSTGRDAIVTLHHVDLPVLSAAELVTVDEDDDLVELGPHPDLRRGLLSALLLRETGAELWSVLEMLQDPVRSSVVEAVDAHGSAVAVDELVRELSEFVTADAATPQDLEEFGLTLRHVHLPKLDAAGLVRYDDDADTVSCEPRQRI